MGPPFETWFGLTAAAMASMYGVQLSLKSVALVRRVDAVRLVAQCAIPPADVSALIYTMTSVGFKRL